MKNRFLIFFAAGAIAVMYSSCRKEQLREMDLPDNTPAQCTNGTYDIDEQDTDCGGPCSPCASGSLDAPCNPANNSITVASQTFNFGSAYVDSTGSTYNMTANGWQGDMYIKLHSAPPATGKKIYYISSSAYDLNKGTLYLNLGFSYYSATSGKIYAERVNGKTRITFCNVGFGSSTGSSTGTGRFTAN